MARSIQLTIAGQFQNDSPLLGQIRERMPDVLPDENITTIKDALFLTNNDALNDVISQSDGPDHLLARLAGLASHDERVELLFLTFFGRRASVEECDAVIDYLGPYDLTTGRLEQVVWSIVTSSEFRFNH
jgi:hypothetical protein